MTDSAAALTIRRASPADAGAIAGIVVAGWQAAYRGILPGDYLDGLRLDSRREAWRMVLESATPEASATWLAELSGGAAGFLHSGPPRDDDVPPGWAEVYAIYVLPDVWRRGLGRTLLLTATEHWTARGADGLVLWVLEQNRPGRAFYEALGWRPDGARQEIEIGSTKALEVRYRRGPG